MILAEQFLINKDLNKTILQAKPPIFWKDKDIIKKQITLWEPTNIKKMIFDLNDIELQIKQNSSHTLNIVLNLFMDTVNLTKTNN